MFGFLALIFFMLAGFGVILIFMLNEKKKDVPAETETPEIVSTEPPKVSPQDVLGRLGLEAAAGQPGAPLKQETANAGPTQAESELSLKYDELFAEHRELQDKYTKLESMLHEKNTQLEKTDKNLTIELKNQKEFNKIKDVLEKEIKDGKDKYRDLQAALATSQTEAKTHFNRVNQLEEKIKKLEVGLLSSEAAINDAQAATQLARKKVAELEGTVRDLNSQIVEKNQKIALLVDKLKELPAAGPQPPAEPAIPDTASPAPPLPANVDEKGGGIPPPEPVKTETEEAPVAEPEPPKPAAVETPAPAASTPEAPIDETTPAAEPPPAEAKPETVSLSPDILSTPAENKPQKSPETPKENPAP